MSSFGFTTAGEFSNAINDCGLFVNGVNLGTRFEGNYSVGGPWPRIGSCEPWTDYATWTPSMKNDIKQFALSSMDALQVSPPNIGIRLFLTQYMFTIGLVLLDLEDWQLLRLQ